MMIYTDSINAVSNNDICSGAEPVNHETNNAVKRFAKR